MNPKNSEPPFLKAHPNPTLSQWKKAPKEAQNFEPLLQKKPWQSVWSQVLTVSWLRKSCPPPKLTLVFFSQRKWLRYSPLFSFTQCVWIFFFFFFFWDLTVVIGVIGVCSWTQGKWLQWDLEHVIELEIWYLWVWRRVTMFFCLSLGVPKSSLVKKSMFLYLLCSVLVSLNLFSSFFFLCCCMLIYIYIVFWVLVCGVLLCRFILYRDEDILGTLHDWLVFGIQWDFIFGLEGIVVLLDVTDYWLDIGDSGCPIGVSLIWNVLMEMVFFLFSLQFSIHAWGLLFALELCCKSYDTMV